MQAERWRPTGGRHAARPEGPRGARGDASNGADDHAVADAERTVRWLRHPATVDRVAAVMYESRTGRRWLSAVEVDRIGYLANARAVLDFLAAEHPS